jgi:2-isopropylmalate synthase
MKDRRPMAVFLFFRSFDLYIPKPYKEDLMKKYSYPTNFQFLRTWPDQIITKAPIWCSVDLRDGNQALPRPMSPAQKLEYFQMLCAIGFKEIEVAYPSASAADFAFTRRLIEENIIPADVAIMGLTQCREDLIRKTMLAFRGAREAIVHAYIATSDLHRERVFHLTPDAMIKKAVESTRLIKELAAGMPESKIRYQFSAEEFTDTDIGFALEICSAVFEAWDGPMIFNLPATVERRPPNQFADMLEIFCSRFSHRDQVTISIHCHNDQGMAVAATELGLLAGADRVEGDLFGNGERTGNVSLVTLASNLLARGIDTGLNFSRLEAIRDKVEELTGLPVHCRQPYAGHLVFTAFSGSHQDAIKKTMPKAGCDDEPWEVSYLLVDPKDFGRSYERIIGITSQSGRGGAAWILETEFGLTIPKAMLPSVGEAVKQFAEKTGREISAAEVHQVFRKNFIRLDEPIVLNNYWPRPNQNFPEFIDGELEIIVSGEKLVSSATGKGPIEAFAKALRQIGLGKFSVGDYQSHAIGKGEDACAIAYVPLEIEGNGTVWGAGIDANIEQAAILAIISALNRSLT